MNKLNLPDNYKSIDEDEMEYIDGGVAITNEQLKAVCFAAGANVTSVAAIAACIDGIAATIAATVPGLGWVTGAVLGLYATKFAVAAVQAIAQDKGMEFSIDYPWGINFSPA